MPSHHCLYRVREASFSPRPLQLERRRVRGVSLVLEIDNSPWRDGDLDLVAAIEDFFFGSAQRGFPISVEGGCEIRSAPRTKSIPTWGRTLALSLAKHGERRLFAEETARVYGVDQRRHRTGPRLLRLRTSRHPPRRPTVHIPAYARRRVPRSEPLGDARPTSQCCASPHHGWHPRESRSPPTTRAKRSSFPFSHAATELGIGPLGR